MYNTSSILYGRILWLSLLGLLTIKASAQDVINARKVEVTTNKTSSIIFPYKITDVDRGSRDILVQKAKGVTNILKVKAARSNFKETNLTVITDDGSIFLFPMYYSSQPDTYAVRASDFVNSKETPVLFQNELTTVQLQDASEKIINHASHNVIKSTTGNEMKLSLLGIYIQDNTLFYHIRIANQSNIPYHTEMLRFSVKDQKKPKRTASQELLEVPIYQYGNTFVIKGKSSEDLIYALPKRTIPNAKILNIELKEKHGGRHLNLKIKNKSILKAQTIPK